MCSLIPFQHSISKDLFTSAKVKGVSYLAYLPIFSVVIRNLRKGYNGLSNT